MASSQDNSPASTGSRPSNSIAPQLERALQNLNVNLEDELTRYRRQRHGRVPPPPPPRRKAQRQTIDLISVPATPSDSAGGPASPPTQLPATAATPPPPPPNPFLQEAPNLESAATDNELPDMDALLATAPGVDAPDLGDNPAHPDDPGMDDEMSPEAALQATETSPEGYLESSEELLKSLAEEQAEPESLPEPYSPDGKNNGLLKLAGLVLVLLAGIGVGFAITYPSQLQRLRSQLFPNTPDTNSPATSDTSEGTANDNDAPSDASEAPATNEVTVDGYKPPGPDLSQREFVELDLESLSTLDVEGTTPSVPIPSVTNPAQSPIPQTQTAPQQPPQTTPTQTTTPAPSATETTAPEQSTASPPKQPSASTPTPDQTAAVPATGSNFYIVTSYTGDASLNKAREFVPDAFIRNFKAGARIQLASFDNRAQAEDQIAFLTQQGITVELFGPTNE